MTKKNEYEEPVAKEDLYLNQEPIDYRTDFGKGFYYLTCDGKECAIMEKVIQYNQMYYESMKKDKDYREDEVIKKSLWYIKIYFEPILILWIVFVWNNKLFIQTTIERRQIDFLLVII